MDSVVLDLRRDFSDILEVVRGNSELTDGRLTEAYVGLMMQAGFGMVGRDVDLADIDLILSYANTKSILYGWPVAVVEIKSINARGECRPMGKSQRARNTALCNTRSLPIPVFYIKNRTTAQGHNQFEVWVHNSDKELDTQELTQATIDDVADFVLRGTCRDVAMYFRDLLGDWLPLAKQVANQPIQHRDWFIK